MAKKEINLNGKTVTLPDFVTLTKVRGEHRFMLSWTEDGAVKRKYFPFTAAGLREVKACAADKNRERKQYGSDFGNITEDEKRAIEEFRKYKRDCEFNGIKPKTMFAAMCDMLKTVQTTTPTFEYVSKMYLESHMKKRTVCKVHLNGLKSRLERISKFFGNSQIHTLKESDFDSFINTLKARGGDELSPTTRRVYLGNVKALLEFAIQRDMIDAEHHFLKNVTIAKPKRVEPSVLSVADAKKLMHTMKQNANLHKYIPMVVMGLFCGIRNQERCRLKYSDLYVGGRNEIFLSCDITKTATDRVIYPSENVKSWLNFARENGVDMSSESYICKGDTEDDRLIFAAMFHKRLKKLGIKLPKNVFRHSAASYMCEIQGFTATSTQLGHTEQILRQHYRRALTKQDAEDFFNITPEAV